MLQHDAQSFNSSHCSGPLPLDRDSPRVYYGLMPAAYIEEIFSSVQGEGLYIGTRHVFVRFSGCDIRCRYCDTPAAHRSNITCRVQKSISSLECYEIQNPVSDDDLSRCCMGLRPAGPGKFWLSLTGGEPLLQKDFLVSWLPRIRPNFHVYLETSGIHHQAMIEVRELIDTVSMDFKLPSATGLRPFWEEHERFLEASIGKDVFVKAVVTADTLDSDIDHCIKLISEIDDSVPLIIQPASGRLAPSPQRLLGLQESGLRHLMEVRVIPQIHKILDLP